MSTQDQVNKLLELINSSQPSSVDLFKELTMRIAMVDTLILKNVLKLKPNSAIEPDDRIDAAMKLVELTILRKELVIAIMASSPHGTKKG